MTDRFADRLRQERNFLGLNQTDFGALGGVTKCAQQNYEKGRRSPDVVYLEGIAAGGADIVYLLTGERARPAHLPPEDDITSATRPSNPAASVSSLDPEGSPIGHAYRVEIPAGWKAVRAVLYPEPSAPRGSAGPDMRDPLQAGFRRFAAGVLLCRPEADGREAVREFASGASLEAAFLRPDGRYLQASPDRPAFGVLPLACSTTEWTGGSGSGDCLVVLPSVRFPHLPGKTYPLPLLFVDGREILPPEDESAPSACAASGTCPDGDMGAPSGSLSAPSSGFGFFDPELAKRSNRKDAFLTGEVPKGF